VITAEQIMTAQFWTQVKGEEERVRTFALIPDDFEGETESLPLDNQVFYWCDSKEWLALGAGEVFGDAEVLACACGECESEREGE
jgi:hypothetical protein